MSNAYYVLGNGFSIDLVYKMEKEKDIDLNNLFSKGENIVYPKTESKGFLSRKYTPNLWDIGARTYISSEDAMHIVTDVITCANVYNLSREKRPGEERESTNIYIRAYSELSSYLRFLFIYYNSLVSDDDLKNILEKVKIVENIEKNLKQGKKVFITTYNYDIFLERLLHIKGIKFDIYGFEDTNADVKIFKPHGSISFSFKIQIQEFSPYRINDWMSESIQQNAEDFKIKYDISEDYPIVSAIIPPAGDAGRCNYEWIKKIREGIENEVSKSSSADTMLIFGISYWHVDRNEIDEILLSMDSKVEVLYINPNPPSELEAVLSSLFRNYIHYSSDKLL